MIIRKEDVELPNDINLLDTFGKKTINFLSTLPLCRVPHLTNAYGMKKYMLISGSKKMQLALNIIKMHHLKKKSILIYGLAHWHTVFFPTQL